MKPLTDLPDRYREKFSMAPNGCWVWNRAISDGYGYVWRIDVPKQDVAHRVIYESLVGPIPSGLTLDHLCRNRACVNPAHLEPVTRGENVLRGVGITARNAKKSSCSRGHPYDQVNTHIRVDGARRCRACHRENQRKYRLRRRDL